jgi:hypothetical protein
VLQREAAYRSEHKEERAAAKKAWFVANRAQVYARNREVHYPKYYAANIQKILDKPRRRQERIAGRPRPERCEICGNLPGSKPLAFDHSHQKGHFRGWICLNCNIALGQVKDDVQHLLKLIAYLQRTSDNTSPQFVLAGI